MIGRDANALLVRSQEDDKAYRGFLPFGLIYRCQDPVQSERRSKACLRKREGKHVRVGKEGGGGGVPEASLGILGQASVIATCLSLTGMRSW